MHRVAWRTYQDGCDNLLHCPQTLHAIHASTWNRERAKAFGSFISRPEANKWAKTKSQKDDIVTSDTSRPVDTCPAFGPPVPAFLRIQNLHGPSGGSRSLVQTYIVA